MKRLALAASLAALLGLAVAGGPALAYTAELSPAGEIALRSLGKLTFVFGEISLRCDFTLSGELLASAALTSGEPAGEVNEVAISRCEGGNWRTVLGLPWTISITSTLGTLPNAMTGVLLTIENFQIQLAVFGGFVNCLWGGDLGGLLAVSGSNPYASGLFTLLGTTLRKISGSLCPNSGVMLGTLALSPEQTITVS